MTRFIKIIKSKNGNMSFWAVVIALVICLIFEGIFEYIQVYSTASDVRTVIRRDLVSTAMQTAQDSYQSIKHFQLYIFLYNVVGLTCLKLGCLNLKYVQIWDLLNQEICYIIYLRMQMDSIF